MTQVRPRQTEAGSGVVVAHWSLCFLELRFPSRPSLQSHLRLGRSLQEARPGEQELGSR